jgi:hypothetical protein
MLRIAGAASLVAGVSAAIVFAAGSSAAQAATRHASAPTQTFVVSSLGDAGPGSLRAAILAANATAAGSSSLISFSVNGTITLAGPLPTITLNDDYIGLNLAGAAAGNSANGVLVWA